MLNPVECLHKRHAHDLIQQVDRFRMQPLHKLTWLDMEVVPC